MVARHDESSEFNEDQSFGRDNRIENRVAILTVKDGLDLPLMDVHDVANAADFGRLARQGGEVVPREMLQCELSAAGEELAAGKGGQVCSVEKLSSHAR